MSLFFTKLPGRHEPIRHQHGQLKLQVVGYEHEKQGSASNLISANVNKHTHLSGGGSV